MLLNNWIATNKRVMGDVDAGQGLTKFVQLHVPVSDEDLMKLKPGDSVTTAQGTFLLGSRLK